MSDHSDGVRSGMLAEFDVPHGQCWPHLIRKFCDGHFCSKKHPLFDKTEKHLRAIHLAQSREMRDLLMIEVGKLWDKLPPEWSLHSLWNEYFVSPWDNWSIGSFDCMLCTPSQNVQESWHRHIMTLKIPGMFKGSTEQVMHVALPQLISMDGILIPDQLLYHVPSVPPSMFEESLWYIKVLDTHFKQVTDGQDRHSRVKFYLSKMTITERLIHKYERMVAGQRPSGTADIDEMIEIARAVKCLQYAEQTTRSCVPCLYNPAQLVCSCKTSRQIGMCPHILVVNHWLGHIALEELCGSLRGEKKRKRGGYNQGTRPALVREDEPVLQKRRNGKSPGSRSAKNVRVQASPVRAPSACAAHDLPYLPPTPPPPPDTSHRHAQLDALQILILEKRNRIADEARIRERVNREMTVIMDTGIRVNRALQQGLQGE